MPRPRREQDFARELSVLTVGLSGRDEAEPTFSREKAQRGQARGLVVRCLRVGPFPKTCSRLRFPEIVRRRCRNGTAASCRNGRFRDAMPIYRTAGNGSKAAHCIRLVLTPAELLLLAIGSAAPSVRDEELRPFPCARLVENRTYQGNGRQWLKQAGVMRHHRRSIGG